MKMHNISHEKEEVTITLSSSELVKICNALFLKAKNSDTTENCNELYSNMITLRDLCQYGHIDDFSLGNVVRLRNECGSKIGTVLSEDEAETFLSYIKDGDLKTAFRNSDWREIVSKIVGKDKMHATIGELSND